jgi:hypothetical protein
LKEHQAEQAEQEDPEGQAAVAATTEVEEDERAAGERHDLQHEHQHLETINDEVRSTYRAAYSAHLCIPELRSIR